MSKIIDIYPYWFWDEIGQKWKKTQLKWDEDIKWYLCDIFDWIYSDAKRVAPLDKSRIDSLDEDRALELWERLETFRMGLQNFELWLVLSENNSIWPNWNNMFSDQELEDLLSKNKLQNAKSSEAYFKVQLARTALERWGLDNLSNSFSNYYHSNLTSLWKALYRND